jgi:menaquinone-dependent protoporphyrinogen IX oxidase
MIGSSIKIGQWTKDVKKFVKNYADALNKFKGKLGFYVCAGYASNPDTYKRVKVEYTIDACQNVGLKKLDMYDAFGGLMDFSETSRMGWLEKRILRVAGQVTTGEKTTDNGYHDLRDWNQIERFTLEFNKKL